MNCLAFPGWTNQILPPFYAYTCTSGITRQTKTTKSPRRFWVKQPKIVKVMAGGSLLILSALCILVLVTGEKKGPKVTEKVQIKNVYIKVTPPTSRRPIPVWLYGFMADSSRKRTDQFRIHYMLSVLVEAMALKVNYKILPFGCQNSMIT